MISRIRPPIRKVEQEIVMKKKTFSSSGDWIKSLLYLFFQYVVGARIQRHLFDKASLALEMAELCFSNDDECRTGQLLSKKNIV